MTESKGYSLEEVKKLATDSIKQVRYFQSSSHRRSQTIEEAEVEVEEHQLCEKENDVINKFEMFASSVYQPEIQSKNDFFSRKNISRNKKEVNFHLGNLQRFSSQKQPLHKLLSLQPKYCQVTAFKNHCSFSKVQSKNKDLGNFGGKYEKKMLRTDQMIRKQIQYFQKYGKAPKRSIDNEFQLKINILSDQDSETWKKEIRNISHHLKELLDYGICDKKINKWCYLYFEQKKKGLLEVFMNKKVCRKSLSDQTLFQIITDENSLLKSIFSRAQGMDEKQKYFLGIQITQYRNFLEEKIASKQKLELDQMEGKIGHNLKNMYLKSYAREMPCPPSGSQINGFYGQLERVQEKYGKLHLLSIKNRKRFKNITLSEEKVWEMIRS